jgi:hypothetical protein
MESEINFFLGELFNGKYNYVPEISEMVNEVEYLGDLMARIPRGYFDIEAVAKDDRFFYIAILSSLILHKYEIPAYFYKLVPEKFYIIDEFFKN